jgi:hypothetical protein
MKVIAFFMVFMFILILSIGLIIAGEWISKRFEGSRFSNWWNRNIITRIDDRFDI